MGERKRVRGTVISVHALGAAVRLDDGRLLAVPIGDVNANRAVFTRALEEKRTLPFDLIDRTLLLAKTRADEIVEPATPAPVLIDPTFEAQIAEYLKSTESTWAPADRPEPFERHLFRKQQRAKLFRGDE